MPNPNTPKSVEMRSPAAALFWLPSVTFFLHFLEELPGFAAWATLRFAPNTTLEFAVVHIPLLWLVTFASYRAWSSAGRSAWAFWALAFQWQFAFNALFHLGSAIAFREYVPGMVMAATVGLPATVWLTAVTLKAGRFGRAGVATAASSGAAISAVAIGALFV
ncbi:MAG: HXXEE domain-containing protein [Pseudomonadota bacterium]